MPSITCAKSPQRVIALNFAGIKRIERDIDAGDAVIRELLGVARKLAAVGGERELVEAGPDMPGQRRDQPHEFLRTSGSPPVSLSFAHALGDEGAHQTVDLLEREQVLARQEGHASAMQ